MLFIGLCEDIQVEEQNENATTGVVGHSMTYQSLWLNL